VVLKLMMLIVICKGNLIVLAERRLSNVQSLNDRQSTCGLPGFETDPWCDDANNNEGCNWDGGACCADPVLTDYCVRCECEACGLPDYRADEYCDDANNNVGCNWDGGACCSSTAPQTVVLEDFCTECECKDPDLGPEPVCAIPVYYGDGYCDDVNNVEECNWDNGDCCTAKLTDPEEWDDYCTQCLCLDPNEQTTIAPTSTAATSTAVTSTAATSTATSGWVPYTMLENTYCAKGARYEDFGSIEAAIDACTVDDECLAVYDSICDGRGFQLCRNSVINVIANSIIGSCVYPKDFLIPGERGKSAKYEE